MKKNLGAFTRIELVALVASLALLGVVVTPLLGGAREGAERTACFNNLRQLGIAAFKYVDEHDGTFPPRQQPAWPEKLRPYYGSIAVLACPADGPMPQSFGSATNIGDRAPRSYVLNGWNDYYLTVPQTSPFPASAIREPAATVIFGEKATDSSHFWMDYSTVDDVNVVEHGRHLRAANGRSGGSNFGFADGSVRFLPWGESFQPLNLWAIDPALRRWTPPEQ